MRIVGTYAYWCRLVPGAQFPRESMSDGAACNMHGGIAEIVEETGRNGGVTYRVIAKREWKGVIDANADGEAAPHMREDLDSAMEWSSPLMLVRCGEEVSGDVYTYEYEVPIVTSEYSKMTVKVLGDSTLRVERSVNDEAQLFVGDFNYRQAPVPENRAKGVGGTIFHTKIASRWTTLQGTVRLERIRQEP